MEIKTEKKRTPREPAVPQMGICDKCKTEALLKKFRFKETSISDGAASFGTVVKRLCENCAPKSKAQKEADVPSMSSKEIRNLMRSVKKSLR
ncbi:hypothetical protein SAMN05720766_104142 [Fibrobacter sp. UWH9]|uniref:hypothetical protein n=1 Tax=unclassified Fibrobacter TaxID=2634177 RepID=UPI0009133005|nr:MULTISPECIES: hypothetical protein [Fibrobacter]MCQ2100844.1 hypothetical protein [Fibrobacter sp.]MCL4101497.1 hypothetical protein [Fibrobacter succinogenes]MDO4946929.1 hypothetical protein [Fibrobacter sp.]OWV15914.1 hypothetical protein B7992_03875 [Fibrobacter sp. UWH1]SHG80346.1 hypothetical protein SAMN05720766_104142 [Fibrobacter sp. UWH9]